MVAENPDPPLVIEPPGAARACVIWLHGLGADGHDFEPLAPQLPAELGLRFVFPHAPVRPVTINGGLRMRAWYDIRSPALEQMPDLEGIAAASDYLLGLVDEQRARGLPPGRVVLAGFSQGGVVALHTALRMAQRPAGVLALSTYLAGPGRPAAGLEVFMGHGAHDPVVPPALALASRDRLRALGARVDWHEYPMPHSVHPDEIVDIGRWLRARLDDTPDRP
jgi:phospholipase/carboxylesterase